jgi:NAD(P)-dependent dehydrogenase (short-subunit alcohol dehydrogenase family)
MTRGEAAIRELKDKVVVITGAASGIGRALALRLAKEGAKLALLDRDAAGAAETKAAAAPAECEVYTTDVADRTSVEQAAAAVVARFGQVDVVVNNAGVLATGSIQEATHELLQWALGVNLWGTIHGTMAFLPHLTKRPAANLVNVSSALGLIGLPNHVAYCTSKFAVRGFTEAVRNDLKRSNVRVSLVIPGGVRTAIAKNARGDGRVPAAQLEAMREAQVATFQTSAEEAADKVLAGIQRDAPRILIGRDAWNIDVLSRLFPGSYERFTSPG